MQHKSRGHKGDLERHAPKCSLDFQSEKVERLMLPLLRIGRLVVIGAGNMSQSWELQDLISNGIGQPACSQEPSQPV